ncbi:uncharacterized protein BDV17DRAFT_290902 [Aspergillus undulatus]|uniref:uncharacterized protein n=1 Tax=Aspergillus undulatus TaxID=1810928 RepID=UPI003CCD6F6C
MTEFQISLESLTSLKDKVVLITGSTSGIGKATVTLCLSLGAKVIAGDVNPFPEAFLQEQQQQNKLPDADNLLYIQTDVSNWASIRTLFVRGVAHFGRIDHVLANAGIGPRSNFLEEMFESGLDTYDEGNDTAGEDGARLAPPDLRVLDVNLLGVIYTLRLSVYYLRRNSSSTEGGETSPSITVTASASSFQDFSAADYTVAKHGVLGLLRGLYTDLQQESFKIRLNAIAPSWTATGIVPEDIVKQSGAEVQEPEVVARSVVMLCVDRMRHGEVIYSWGGRFMEINRCEGGLLNGVAGIVPNVKAEGVVMEKLKGR